jgi:hypothetical protein
MYLTGKDKHRPKVKVRKNIFLANGTQRQAEVAMLISAKAGFKPKLERKDKPGYFILIKETIHQEDITTVNIYATNIGTPNFIKQTLLEIKA